ncbi:MAG TPA: MoaD/ThiS family protein [Bacillota bacterium]|nr:MoaD/ThiS family protein [Bacillota bacterium]HOL10293.1 MoaD/ThiS family protein [Bacillota bacterium]HPO97411.1 MoaD/ThiS family protein [Bacillota bacterium]
MKVKVRLFATLREGRSRESELEVPEATTVLDIINALNIPEEEVALLLINGRDGKLTSTLTEGDTVSLFPPVGGG